MNTIYIGIHHTFYNYQEFENEDIAIVSNDLNKVRAWCDSFKPYEEDNQICEWRSIKTMDLNKDYCTPSDHGLSKFDVIVPTVYSQE